MNIFEMARQNSDNLKGNYSLLKDKCQEHNERREVSIRVIAFAPNDGWAFIIQEEKIFLLRPPYIPSQLKEVSEKVVENAVCKYGFEECDIVFSSINDVIRFLKDLVVESRKALGIPVPSSEELRTLLEYASDGVILEYLRRADEELIPERKVEAAESIALDLMKLEQVRNSPEMKKKAERILEKCKSEKERFDEEILLRAKSISREIVNREFPDEKEYFDLLFELTIDEIRDMESGEEVEFLRVLRSVHPRLVLGHTPNVIVATVEVLHFAGHGIREDVIKKKITNILEEEGSDKEKIPVISEYLTGYLREKKNKRMVNEG